MSRLQEHAVLSYQVLCNDPESGCGGMIFGEAYFSKENGVWKVDNYQTILL